jgi:flagellar basal body-associated protein FliL
MKAKTLKVLILVVALIVCLSVALYAASTYNSSNQAKVTTSAVTADDNDGPTIIKATKADRSQLRKAK